MTTFKDDDDTLSIANDTLYGLGAGVWSRDANRCYRFGRAQYEVWKHTDLIIDVVRGRGGMFSLDSGREQRFLTRSTVCATPSP